MMKKVKQAMPYLAFIVLLVGYNLLYVEISYFSDFPKLMVSLLKSISFFLCAFINIWFFYYLKSIKIYTIGFLAANLLFCVLNPPSSLACFPIMTGLFYFRAKEESNVAYRMIHVSLLPLALYWSVIIILNPSHETLFDMDIKGKLIWALGVFLAGLLAMAFFLIKRKSPETIETFLNLLERKKVFRSQLFLLPFCIMDIIFVRMRLTTNTKASLALWLMFFLFCFWRETDAALKLSEKPKKKKG